MAGTSGDGWVRCARGHRHWGRYGAAGLLVRHRDADGGEWVLVLRRAGWSDHGGTWCIPGGALRAGESARAAALRETAEESDVAVRGMVLAGEFTDDHGGWSYTSVVVRAPVARRVAVRGAESTAARWVRVDQLARLALHPGFAQTWPRVSAVDVAAG